MPAEFGFYSLVLLELSALGAELSVLAGLALSPELELPEPSLELFPAASLLSAFCARVCPEGDLWSVAYQPEPLKTIPAGVKTLRKLFLLHSGQRLRGSSVKD